MKGMYGVCLYPGRAYVEIKVRLFNRTSLPQSFRWTASKTAHRDEQQQSFADESVEDFSSYYDPDRQTGLIHVADHRLIHSLSDFSFLAPYETKAFNQFWYPIQKIGPARKANVDAAISFGIHGEFAQIGVCVTRTFPNAVIKVEHSGNTLAQWTRDLQPAAPFLEQTALPADVRPDEITCHVLTSTGRPLISYTEGESGTREIEISAPSHAEPPLLSPKKATIEQLYLTGLQLQQRHCAAGQPQDYWREALRRDGNDSRCNNALGLWLLRRGDFVEAEAHFRRAIATLTAGNPNPYDREPFYCLGVALRYQERDEEAHDAFDRASWSLPWRAPALYAIAEIETKRGNYAPAIKHLHEALRLNADNNNARNLAAVLFRRFGRTNEAEHLVRESLALDPLDAWACHLGGRQVPGDNQTRLDLAFDYARAGLYGAAVEVLTAADLFIEDGSLPPVRYALASFYARTGDLVSAQREYLAAAQSSPERCSPHRLEEMIILARAVALQPHDARAQFYLANLLYERGRSEEAMELWENSAQLDGSFAAVWRNLGTGYYNLHNDVPKAFEAFNKALSADSGNARILYERDQLWKRAGVPPVARLKELEAHSSLAESLDELAIELAELFNDVQQPVRALALLSSRQFQSGEGRQERALAQFVRTHLQLGRQALKDSDPMRALNLLFTALHPPTHFGGTKQQHPYAAEIWFWLGEAYRTARESSSAREYWQQAAGLSANFRPVVNKFPSEMVFYSGLALERLGERFASRRLLRELWFQGRKLAREKPQRDDSLTEAFPALHEVKDDPVVRNQKVGLFLQAQARLGLGQYKLARRLLDQVLILDPNHGRALDLTAELPQEK
jgi:tetratricopeptide (TPR) repeat protein